MRRAARGFTSWVVVAALALGMPVVSCSSDEPQLSGLPFFNERTVSVGEIVKLTVPLDDRGTPDWRVTSYDSLMLSVASPPRIERNSDGGGTMTVSLLAKTPGKTEVVLQRTPGADSGSDTRRVFKVNIIN